MRGIYGKARKQDAPSVVVGNWNRPFGPSSVQLGSVDVNVATEGAPVEVRWPPSDVQESPVWRTAWRVASIASCAACVYHGYKRNESIGWALGWGLFGTLAPVVAPAIALAQGFGQPK